MAWIFALLVIINGAYWGWEHFYNAPAVALISDDSHLPQLILIRDKAGTSHAAVEQVAPPPAAQPTLQTSYVCYLVGPFADAEVQAFQQRITAHGMISRVRAQDVSNRKYQVYLPPYQYTQDAQNKAAELQSKGYKAEVVQDGIYTRAVMLGSFHAESTAQDLVQKLVGMGYPAEAREEESGPVQTWIYVSPSQPGSTDSLGVWLHHQSGVHEEMTPCE
ncbi:MAG: SPOR domain-containing protein [Pseudomonadales bacterium]|nr:SPOR domain-containing protein [Pseudomonadales bacterium]